MKSRGLRRMLVLLALCSDVPAHPPGTALEDSDLTFRQITEHVYIAHGPQAFPSTQTAGYMNNPGFVLTRDGVVVVDPGSSVQVGRKLLNGIRRITEKQDTGKG